MTEKQERPGFSVDFPSGEAHFVPASKQAWFNYLTKLRQGEATAAMKELLYACCESHKFDEKLGEHQLAPLLDELPACLDDITDAIDEITRSGESVIVDDKARTVKLLNMTFRAPRGNEWSTYQENLSSPNISGGEASEKLLTKLCDAPDIWAAFLGAHPSDLGTVMRPIGALAGKGIKIKRKKA